MYESYLIVVIKVLFYFAISNFTNFDVIDFGLYKIGLMASYCVFDEQRKFVRLCYEGEVDLSTFY